MRLIDADALLEALGKNPIIAYHKNIVDQCEAYIKKYQSMTGFGYEVDQANKRLRLHKQYMDDITNLITNAPTVEREGWVSVPIEPTREMLEAAKLEQADHGSYEEWIDYGYGEDVIATYKAMIQAAPTYTE